MKKNNKKWTKSLIFCLFPPSLLLPTAAFTAKAKPSEAKPKTKTKIIIVFQNKKDYEYLRIPVTRVYEPKVNEFLFRMKKVKVKKEKDAIKKV